METNPDAMAAAYDRLMIKLNDAARVASARLSDLIDIPANPD